MRVMEPPSLAILDEKIEGPISCPYLVGQTAHFAQAEIENLDSAQYQVLLDKGYRKFGKSIFRPVCRSCKACTPIRVPIATFAPTRSQRRNLLKNQDLVFKIEKGSCSPAKVDLIQRYHFGKFLRHGWPFFGLTEQTYEEEFLNNSLQTLELSIWKEDICIGILLAEETSVSLSAIYHFYDDRFSDRGIGTLLILKTILEANLRNLEYCYLGYYVKGSKSMEYKANFGPYELLIDGNWVSQQSSLSLV